MSVTLHIDGDLVAFRAAAAAETRSIDVEHIASKRVKEFKHRTEFKHWLKNNPKWKEGDFFVFDKQTPEPIENCLHTVKTMINGFKQQLNADNIKVYLSGKGNFRSNIPLPYQYKCDRVDQTRPLLLNDARDYLKNRFNAIVVDGVEADDIIAWRTFIGFLNDEKHIAVTLDKDQLGTTGWVFDWNKMQEPFLIEGLGELYRNEKGDVKGHGFLWRVFQVCLGDATDGYCPLDLYKIECEKKGVKPKKCGEVYFYNRLKDCKTIKEAVAETFAFYQEFYPEPITYTAWDGKEYTKDWKGILEMYIQCAVMQDGSGWDKLITWEMCFD